MPAQSPTGRSSIPDEDGASLAPSAATNDGRPITILITRAVREGSEEAFEATLKAFIPKSLTFPGHLGVFMLRPPPGGREFGAVLQFGSQNAWQGFQRWPEYQTFLAEIEQYLQMPARTESLCGLETWFSPLGADFLRTPPRWKIAVVTWIGVCVSVYVVNSLFSLFDQNWPMLVNLLVSNAVIVAALTWAVMPALSWLFRHWLSSPGTSTTGSRVTGARAG